MDAWGWLAVIFVLAVMASAVWALFHQRRQFPRNRDRIGDPDLPRNRDPLKWIGMSRRSW